MTDFNGTPVAVHIDLIGLLPMVERLAQTLATEPDRTKGVSALLLAYFLISSPRPMSHLMIADVMEHGSESLVAILHRALETHADPHGPKIPLRES
jgi:hypothetical protein